MKLYCEKCTKVCKITINFEDHSENWDSDRHCCRSSGCGFRGFTVEFPEGWAVVDVYAKNLQNKTKFWEEHLYCEDCFRTLPRTKTGKLKAGYSARELSG